MPSAGLLPLAAALSELFALVKCSELTSDILKILLYLFRLRENFLFQVAQVSERIPGKCVRLINAPREEIERVVERINSEFVQQTQNAYLNTITLNSTKSGLWLTSKEGSSGSSRF